MPNIPYNIRIQKQLREALQKIADADHPQPCCNYERNQAHGGVGMSDEKTDYRTEIEAIISWYSRVGDDLRGIIDGAPASIDRQEAISIASWLRDEADEEWGVDPRHQAIAADIMQIVGD
jgi:hypothetical protein